MLDFYLCRCDVFPVEFYKGWGHWYLSHQVTQLLFKSHFQHVNSVKGRGAREVTLVAAIPITAPSARETGSLDQG